eukprot:m.60672 g.60672  ORF g.60672 m.60672 type:complete len:480 (-) comp13856_c0_seq1:147-1586(-)
MAQYLALALVMVAVLLTMAKATQISTHADGRLFINSDKDVIVANVSIQELADLVVQLETMLAQDAVEHAAKMATLSAELSRLQAALEPTVEIDELAVFNFTTANSTVIQGNDTTFFDNFGVAVAVSGNTLVVGANLDDDPSASGAAYVFEVDSAGNVVQRAKLRADTPLEFDNFGKSVAVSASGTIVVGAPEHDVPVTNSGAVYVFEQGADKVYSQLKLLPSDGTTNIRFGFAVAVADNGMVVASSPYINISTGAVYVYEKNQSGSYEETNILVASDASQSTQYGIAVAATSNTIVVGAHLDDLPGSFDAGAVYVYERDAITGLFQQAAKLLSSDGAGSDRFGIAVAISNYTVVVGAQLDDTIASGDNRGSAYVFERNASGVYAEVTKLVADGGKVKDRFGAAVAVSKRVVVVASIPDGSNAQGIVYIYPKNSTGQYEYVGQFEATDVEAVVATDSLVVVGYPNEDSEGVARVFQSLAP